MRICKGFVYVILVFCALVTSTTKAQSGDQILDGIGETALVARYLFNGDIKDWSRNNLHGSNQNSKLSFINDDTFGKVLSLSADSKNFVSLPGNAVTAEESITITTWIYLRSPKRDQYLFDLGSSENSHFFAAPSGTKLKEGYIAGIGASPDKVYETTSSAIETNKWNHLSVVFDITSKSLTTYVNGVLVSEIGNISLELKNIFQTNQNNTFYIGKSIASEASYLNAKVHDFRVYRIPLSSAQIVQIHDNALNGENTTVVKKEKPVDDLPVFDKKTPQLYNQYLVNVPDIHVETVVGHLPRLPRYIKGVYQNKLKREEVRVLWPSPENNDEVLEKGEYIITGSISGSNIQPKAIVTVKETKSDATPNQELEAFNLNQVSLNSNTDGSDTKFIENRDKFITTLSRTNPDAFLYMFRNTFGQKQPEGAEALGVWDSQETKLRGHATGHYLTAIAQAYAGSGHDIDLQNNFKNKMDYMVDTLYKLSQMSGQAKEFGGIYVSDPTAVPPGPGKTDFDSELSEEGIRTDYWNWGKGYISAYPPDQFIMLEKGATYGGQKTQIWAPYYTLHKILAGLMDVYEVSGNKKALEVAEGMGQWVHARMSQLPTDTLISMWNTYIAGEFGGMNEAMARLYRITNKTQYLETAKLFDNIKMFYGDANHSHGLAKNVDTFRGLHANQHIPQIMGALEMYRDSDTPDYYHIADNFWYKAKNDYMYSIGGVAGARNPANAECFISQPATLYENGLSSGGQNETCATYNMLKLTRNLFLFDQRGELMDYYEKGLYNHILASVAENSPANTYHVPLRPGSVKHFGNPDMKGFTCCNGTAIESSTKLQNSIYFKNIDNNALYVNLYVPSTLNWEEKGVTIEQTTSFPKEDQTTFKIKGNGTFDFNVRVPSWAIKGFFVKINSKKVRVVAEPGSYLTLNREWKDGDTIELRMPFQFHLDPVMDQQNIASLFYGPVLLVAQESEPRKEWRKVTFKAKDISKSIEGDTENLEFTIDGIVFKPFYKTYGRHSVYLDVTLE